MFMKFRSIEHKEYPHDTVKSKSPGFILNSFLCSGDNLLKFLFFLFLKLRQVGQPTSFTESSM